jgi:hypothetical protein
MKITMIIAVTVCGLIGFLLGANASHIRYVYDNDGQPIGCAAREP